jgi:hypothetical protein
MSYKWIKIVIIIIGYKIIKLIKLIIIIKKI